MTMHDNDNPTVYSTEHGDLRKTAKKSTVSRLAVPPGKQTTYIHRESKGRAGKTVTIVKNLQLEDEELKTLAKQLKLACGSGGTIKAGSIEIQGEHREKIAQVLRSLGYQVKISG